MKRKTCASCGKSRNEDKFREDGRYKDGRAPICEACRFDKQESDAAALTRLLAGVEPGDQLALIRRVFEALPTVTIPAVPILAAGGPYFGTGSPPEGDFFSKADLELIAEQTNQLERNGELRPPNKLGHSEEQRLLQNSGLPVSDELPAAGWLTNFRVEEISGVWKLLADVMSVPAKLGQVLAAGGYRTRSVELSKVVSQVDGKTYEGVVTGLAWLGAKAPAVRTLDDVWNLYAVGDVVWEEEDGIMDLLSDLTAAINTELAPGEPSYMWELWVDDVNLTLDKCTASDWDSDTTWIIGFTIGAGNEPTIDPRDQWVPSTMKLVEIDQATADTPGGGGGGIPDDEGEYSAGARYIARRAEARAKFQERAADTKGMRLTDEQVAGYAKLFAIEGEGDELRTKVEEHIKAQVAAEPVTQPEVEPADAATELAQAFSQVEVPGADPKLVQAMGTAFAGVLAPRLKTLEERAARGDRAYTDRFAQVRDEKIFTAIHEGRLNPADREQWVEFYDANPGLALKQLESLPVNPLLLITYGVDTDGLTEEQRQKGETDAGDAWVAQTVPEAVTPAPAREAAA